VLNKTLEAALNTQIREEMFSSYLYLSMSAYCESNNYPGVAHWLKLQAQEELAHAMKFYGFIIDRGGKVALEAIPQPEAEFGALPELFEKVLAHEEKITGLIHNLYTLATEAKDYASIPLLQWFVSEQVEEEKNATEVLNLMKVAAGSPHTLLFADRELGKRQ